MLGEEAKVTICACRLCVPYPLIRRVLVHAALLEVGEGARGATAVQRANIAPDYRRFAKLTDRRHCSLCDVTPRECKLPHCQAMAMHT